MRIINFKYIALIIALTGLCACQDFLNVEPVGKLIPSKVSDVENLLNNIYTCDFQFMDNNRGCFYAMLGDNITVSQNQADNVYYVSNPNIDRYAAYIFYRPYINPVTTHYFWSWGIYRSAGLFNTIISGIQNLPASESESASAKQVIAQAKAGRAWIYMHGALVYGPMYNPGGANDKKVIPYRIDESPLAPNPQLSTTAEIFDLLLKDLTDALYAPDVVGNPVRAGKVAVLALHAQYYMYKRDWDNMLSYADQAWKLALQQKGNNIDNLIYNFNDFVYNETAGAYPEGTDPEVNWSLRHKGGDTDFRQSFNRENLLYRISPTGVSLYPSDEYLALFDASSDLRYKLFMLKSVASGASAGDGIRQYNYRGSKLLYNEGITYPGLLLMRAEAYARTGKRTEALADLNTLRRYRFSNTAPTDLQGGSSLTDDQLLGEIINERRREQPFESFERTVDIKRYVYDTGKPWSKTSITHTIGSKTYTAPVDDEYFTVPIDNAVIAFNPHWGLTPNPVVYAPK